MTGKRDARALFKAIEEQALEDDLAEVMAMSDDDLDRFIDENGGDSKAIRADGAALAKELSDRRERLAWHGEMERDIDAFQKMADASKSLEKLPRHELLARLATARKNPRFAAPVAALFSKRTNEAATDEELQALLDQIELLAKLEDE